MKKLAIGLMLLVAPLLMMGQSFDKYEDMDGVDGVFISQHMFKLLSKISVKDTDADAQKALDMIKNLTGINVLTTTNTSIGNNMKADFDAYTASSKMEELMRVKNDGKYLKFYSKPGSTEEKISELYMFMTDKENGSDRFVLLSITGDIDLDAISDMAGDLDGVPGAKELKNIKKDK